MLLLKHHIDYPSDSLIKIESKYTRWLSELEENHDEDEIHCPLQPKKSPPPPSSVLSPLTGSFDSALRLNILDYDLPEIYGYLLAIFKTLHIMDILDLTPSRLLDFFIDVRETYQETPYHSFKHACDVVMMLYLNYMELKKNRQQVEFLLDLEISVIFIAAICHDAGHNGRNNDFHKRTRSPLTTRFEEKTSSYLESLSVEIAFELIEKHHLFHAFSTVEEQCIIREWTETAILLTDMKYHYDLLQMARILRRTLNRFSKNTNNEEDEEDEEFNPSDHDKKDTKDKAYDLLSALETSYTTMKTDCRQSHTEPLSSSDNYQEHSQHSQHSQHLIFSIDEDDWNGQEAFSAVSSNKTSVTTSTSHIPLTAHSTTEGIYMTPPSSIPFSTSPSSLHQLLLQSPSTLPNSLSPKQRLGLACVLLHAADISNPIRPWNISKQWSDLVVEEFYEQGDDEKQAGFTTISAGMDRDLHTQASTGIKFNSIVRAYYEEVAGILALPSSSKAVNHQEVNDGSSRSTTTNILMDFLDANTAQWEELSQSPLATSLTTTKSARMKTTASTATVATGSEKPTNHRKMVSVPAGTVRMPALAGAENKNNKPKVRPLPIVRTTSHSSFLFSPPTVSTSAFPDQRTAVAATATTTTTTSKQYRYLHNSGLRRNSSNVVIGGHSTVN